MMPCLSGAVPDDVDAARGEDNPDSFNVATTEMEDLADLELPLSRPS